MPWTIPDKGEGISDYQSVMHQEYLEILVAGLLGTDCVLSGATVLASGVVPSMNLPVAKGAVLSAGALFAVAAANVAITTANATFPRIDLVVVNSAGTKAVRAGTPATFPKPPVRTANDVGLATVYVPAGATAIANTNITDLRILRGGSASGGGAPMLLKKVTTPVTFNTTLAIQTYFTVTIPDGLLAVGQIVRVKCGGTMLMNSGTPTATLTIAFGGTTMFADVTTAFTASATRRAWALEFDVISQAASDQALNGIVFIGPTAAPAAAPTTGTGDILTPTAITLVQTSVPINGASAINTDAGSSALTVQWTMSVSNVADEIVMEYATAELI